MIAGAKDKLRGKMIINPKYVCDFFDAAAQLLAGLLWQCVVHITVMWKSHLELEEGEKEVTSGLRWLSCMSQFIQLHYENVFHGGKEFSQTLKEDFLPTDV